MYTSFSSLKTNKNCADIVGCYMYVWPYGNTGHESLFDLFPLPCFIFLCKFSFDTRQRRCWLYHWFYILTRPYSSHGIPRESLQVPLGPSLYYWPELTARWNFACIETWIMNENKSHSYTADTCDTAAICSSAHNGANISPYWLSNVSLYKLFFIEEDILTTQITERGKVCRRVLAQDSDLNSDLVSMATISSNHHFCRALGAVRGRQHICGFRLIECIEHRGRMTDYWEMSFLWTRILQSWSFLDIRAFHMKLEHTNLSTNLK